LQSLQVGACLDTAHLFAAGYDIKSEAGLASTLELIDTVIGLERVPIFHANDSKIPLGGRVDRHEHIGKGKIGEEAFRRFLTHPRLGAAAPEGLPGRAFLAETPIDDPGDDRRNVAALWEFAGLKEQAPEVTKGFSMLTAAAKKKVAKQVKSSQAASDKIRATVAAADRLPRASTRGRGRLSTPAKKSPAKPKKRGRE
jgi:Xylose isomerase-like TIM barrel